MSDIRFDQLSRVESPWRPERREPSPQEKDRRQERHASPADEAGDGAANEDEYDGTPPVFEDFA